MNKLKISLPVLFCFFSILSHSQLTGGIKGGFSFGRLSGFDGNSRSALHAGVFLHKTINKNWCFQPELLYSGEGQRYFSDGEERTIALDYFQLPLMVQYFPLPQLYFEFGPQFGILASAEDKSPSGENLNVKSNFTNAQAGINVGVGVKANRNIGFYGRYCFGLTDVSLFDNIVDHSQVGQVGLFLRLK